MRRLASPLLLALLLATPAGAAPSAADLQRAKEISTAGTAAFNAELYPDAEQAFRDVYELTHSPSAVYNLALTLDKEKKWGAAADAYDQYAREASAIPAKDRRAIERRAEELHRRADRQEEVAAPESGPQVPASSVPGNGTLEMSTTDEKPIAIDAAVPVAQPADEGARPIYKRWWLWTAVAAVVVAGAVTVAVVATRPAAGELPSTTFPAFGPGSAALLQF